MDIRSLPTKHLANLLQDDPIEVVWKNIIFTNLLSSQGARVKYIAGCPELCNARRLEYDILEGLSIGEISILYEYSLAFVDHDSRRLEGQYFTPDDIARVMANKSVSFSHDGIWLDPCSGVGNLSFWLASIQEDPESFLRSKLFLVDKDSLALFIARYIMVTTFQRSESDLFSLISDRFISTDFLESSNLPRYDYIIMNPPYVPTEVSSIFLTSESRDVYAFFLEKAILSTKGYISITPQSFTNGTKFKVLRRLLLDNFSSINIYCFDNVPDSIFRGVKFGSQNTNKANSTRAAITVARKDNGNEKLQITPLLRWRASERQFLLSSLDKHLSSVARDVDIFPKVQRELVSLYYEVRGWPHVLGDFLATHETEYCLFIPSTPRYFISALKGRVVRSSMKQLFFCNQEQLDLAYLVLNSSYTYWWWRTNDGGMTLSDRTLLSLPIPEELVVNPDLIREIEISEKENIVVKKNAGKDCYNVKHDLELIRRINESLLPLYSDRLIRLHNNSEV